MAGYKVKLAFSGGFAKLRKATISFVMSVRPSFLTKQHTFYVQKKFLFENRAAYEIMWKYTVELDKPQTTIWCMPNACWT
jgi:formaldehyde-activating enzyme involved in methanogenesis